MDVFDRMYKSIESFNQSKHMELWLDANTDFVTGLNKTRLLQKGTDVDGKEIRTFKAAQGENYSAFTINMRLAEGKQYAHVDLYDTGAFHNSVKVNSKSNQFSIEADDKKEDGNISDNLDVESALGLENLQPVINKYLPELRSEVLWYLRK